MGLKSKSEKKLLTQKLFSFARFLKNEKALK